MRGVILAAGRGSRLNGVAERIAEVPGRGGWHHARRAPDSERCERAGVRNITVVTGCQADRVRRACGQRVTYVENARYAQTNSMYSLWMARPLLYEGFVVLNCDVVFHPVLLDDLLCARHDNALLLAYREADQPLVRRRGDEGQGPMRPGRRHVQDDGPGGGGRREPRDREVRSCGRRRPRRHHGPSDRPPAAFATGRRARSPSSRKTDPLHAIGTPRTALDRDRLSRGLPARRAGGAAAHRCRRALRAARGTAAPSARACD